MKLYEGIPDNLTAEQRREEIEKRRAAYERSKQALYEHMSDMSETHWCAAWDGGCEHVLWGLVTGQMKVGDNWGMERVDQQDRDRLVRLHTECGGWWAWPADSHDPVFLPLSIWRAYHAAVCR